MGRIAGPVPTGKVRAGFFSFTEITDPAAHRAYNRWHQLDHLPEQLPLEGVAGGQRWVSTPACRRARTVVGGRLAPVHYVTLYLMGEPLQDTLASFAALGARLRDEGRFFEQRRAHLSGPFVVTAAAASNRVLVSPAAVAFRPGSGIYVVVEEPAPGTDPAAVRRPPDPGPALAVGPVAGVWAFASSAELAGARWRPGRLRITVCFLDGDPLAAAAELGPLLAGPTPPDDALVPVFAGPFETIVPGRWDWFDAD